MVKQLMEESNVSPLAIGDSVTIIDSSNYDGDYDFEVKTIEELQIPGVITSYDGETELFDVEFKKSSDLRQNVYVTMYEDELEKVGGTPDETLNQNPAPVKWWETLVKFLEQYCANINPENGEWIDEAKGMSGADAFERIYGADPYNAGFISDASEGKIYVTANEATAKPDLVKFLEEYIDNIDLTSSEFINETEGSSAAADFETVFGEDPYNGMFISEDGTILI